MNESYSPSLSDRVNQILRSHEIEAGRDDADQRFFASYLLGHLGLIEPSDASHSSLDRAMQASLDNAFRVDRLSDTDKQGIQTLWQQIVSAL